MQKDVLFPFKSFMDYLAEKKKHPPLTGRCSEKACCEVSPQQILSTAGHPSFYFTIKLIINMINPIITPNIRHPVKSLSSSCLFPIKEKHPRISAIRYKRAIQS